MPWARPEWTWREFDRALRPRPGSLLRCLPAFDDSVLVAGCQRSGTTMLADIIAASPGMAAVGPGDSSELAAALSLAGELPLEPGGRYCFQTTYLDDRWREYLNTAAQFRLVWCVRNPYSVVTSMLYHWAPFALIDTFRRCGAERLSPGRRALFRLLGVRTVAPVRRACSVYVSKVAQVLALKPALGDAMLVVDYDHLVTNTDECLRRIYDFIDLPYDPGYGMRIDAGSMAKADRLTAHQRRFVAGTCLATYERALACV